MLTRWITAGGPRRRPAPPAAWSATPQGIRKLLRDPRPSLQSPSHALHPQLGPADGAKVVQLGGGTR
jgi:hypothetical protein